MHRAVARPVLACCDDAARKVEHPPPSFGEVTRVEPEVDDLCGPHGRVVHASEERLQVRTASSLVSHRRKQPGDLGRIGDSSRVHLLVDGRSVPPEPIEGVISEVTFLHCGVEHFTERSPLAPRCLGCSRLAVQLAAQGVQRPSQDIGLREGTNGQGVALYPVQGLPPLLVRPFGPCVLVEGPRVQGAPQDPRLRIGRARVHQGRRDGGECVGQSATGVPGRTLSPLVKVFVDKVVPRRPLLDSS